MPRFRTTLVLLLACTACGLLLWVLHRAAPGAAYGLADEGRMLFPAPLREINYLLIEQGGQRMELRREMGGWRMTQPLEVHANQEALLRLLDRCEAAPLHDRITRHEMELRQLSLSDFGLQPPQARIVVTGPSYRAELWLGGVTSTSNEFFCAFAPADEVLLTDRKLLDLLPDSPLALGDARLFRDDVRRVGAIGIRRPGQPYIKLSLESHGWRLTQPLKARADEKLVSELLAKVASSRIERYIWPAATAAASDAKLPLQGAWDQDEGAGESEVVELQLWLAGDPVARHIVLGGVPEELPGTVAAIPPEGGGVVVAVSNSLMQAALHGVAGWRDRRVWGVTEGEISRVTVSGRKISWSAQRNGTGVWELLSPVTEMTERGAMSALLAPLLELEATAFEYVAEGHGSEPEEDGLRVELLTPDGPQRMQQLLHGDDATTAGVVRLTFEADTTLWLVPEAAWRQAAEQLSAPLALRNRTILQLSADELRRITVRRAAATNRLEVAERDVGSELWRAGVPEQNLNPVNLESWLELLARLRALRVESFTPLADIEPYGLKSPWLEVTLDLTSKESLRRILLVGETTPDGGRFAMVKGQETLFVLAPETWQQLEKSLWQGEPHPATPGIDLELVVPQPLEML